MEMINILQIAAAIGFFGGLVCGIVLMGTIMKIKKTNYLTKLQKTHTIIDNHSKLPIRIIEL